MALILPLILGSIFAAWSMLSLFGGEHERRAREIASAPKPKASDNPATQTDPASKPAKSGVVR